MNTQERKNRIIARGEDSNHSHIVTGEATVTRNGKGEILIDVTGEASLKHLMEDAWLSGQEVWTQEHTDIPLEKGTYQFIQQQEYDPYADTIRAVQD